jgi:perosamine synthetase
MGDQEKKRKIPVCSTTMDGNEGRYLKECVDTNWVSSSGPFVKRFEAAFAQLVKVPHAVTTSSGTGALHMALEALELKAGDEVIVPALTMIASGNTIRYTGATPVIVDVNPETGNICPSQVEAAFTPRTRAVMVVHLYGLPCDMEPLLEMCRARGVAVVEDAAEAIGTTAPDGRPAGGLGDLGAFSFFANKVITAGEGGMVVCRDEELARKVRLLKDQWFVPEPRFYHPRMGFNYRMSNLQAAVGLAQLEQVEQLVQARINVATRYRELLQELPWLELPADFFKGGKNSHWMYAVRLTPDAPCTREFLASRMREDGIDTRDFFIPLNLQPAFNDVSRPCPVAESMGKRGLLLPTGAVLTAEDQQRVADSIRDCFAGM